MEKYMAIEFFYMYILLSEFFEYSLQLCEYFILLNLKINLGRLYSCLEYLL